MTALLRIWIRAALALAMIGFLSWGSHAGAQTNTVSTPQVRAELVAHAPNGVQAGQPLWVGLMLDHAPEWHTYWINPGDSGLPTQLEWNLPPGVSAGEVQWPLPKQLRAGSLTNYGFEGRALLAVPLQVSSAYKPDGHNSLTIQLHANWLICRLECIPQEGDFSLNLPVNSSTSTQAAAFEAVFAQQPKLLTEVQATASAGGAGNAQFLKLDMRGLPTALQGRHLNVFAFEPELLDPASQRHAAATQAWAGDVWQAQLPLNHARTASPSALSVLLMDDQDAQHGWRVKVTVQGAWPAPSDEPVTATALDIEAAPSSVDSISFVLALLGALLGGLILNLMPCVLPVLAIKFLGFSRQHVHVREQRLSGLAYTAGVVMSFLALGAALLALRAAGEQLGWGFQLQSPAVVAALAVLFTLIALNLFGLFELGQVLPSAWLSYEAQHPVTHAFLSGVLAVVVASPCTAPFMGASLGLAMTLPALQALSIFACMGLGLALPYVLASFVPSVARFMPKPGAWMVTLRQCLGFPMLATVVWLLWVLGLQTHANVSALALMGLVVLACLVWALRYKSPVARAFQALLLAGWLSLLVVMSQSFDDSASASSSSADSASAAASHAALSATPGGLWASWSEDAVQRSLAQGQPVFVDFTAAWCVTCQINKQTTLSQSSVLQSFAEHKVQLMRADWTRRDPAITRALTALGRSGVPVYVLYAPGRTPVVLSELLSVDKVQQVLRQLP